LNAAFIPEAYAFDSQGKMDEPRASPEAARKEMRLCPIPGTGSCEAGGLFDFAFDLARRVLA
jgi:hypothetical protein